jgi:hypothetical protein
MTTPTRSIGLIPCGLPDPFYHYFAGRFHAPRGQAGEEFLVALLAPRGAADEALQSEAQGGCLPDDAGEDFGVEGGVANDPFLADLPPAGLELGLYQAQKERGRGDRKGRRG